MGIWCHSNDILILFLQVRNAEKAGAIAVIVLDNSTSEVSFHGLMLGLGLRLGLRLRLSRVRVKIRAGVEVGVRVGVEVGLG